jgi:DNA invertase Pin-like site-specific DNA recombinase
MARTFAYCRVGTLGQTVENQIREIEAAGFRVEKRRLVTETVSGQFRDRTTSWLLEVARSAGARRRAGGDEAGSPWAKLN